jgi:hypothetical protein
VLQAAGESLGFERLQVSRGLHVTLNDLGGGEEQPPLKNVTVVVLILEICHICHGVTVTCLSEASSTAVPKKKSQRSSFLIPFSNNKIKTYGRERYPEAPIAHVHDMG